MVFSTFELLWRTDRVDLSLLFLVMMPSQPASFGAFSSPAGSWAGVFASSCLEPSCANPGIDSEKASTDVNNGVSSFFTIWPPLSLRRLRFLPRKNRPQDWKEQAPSKLV